MNFKPVTLKLKNLKLLFGGMDKPMSAIMRLCAYYVNVDCPDYLDCRNLIARFDLKSDRFCVRSGSYS